MAKVVEVDPCREWADELEMVGVNTDQTNFLFEAIVTSDRAWFQRVTATIFITGTRVLDGKTFPS